MNINLKDYKMKVLYNKNSYILIIYRYICDVLVTTGQYGSILVHVEENLYRQIDPSFKLRPGIIAEHYLSLYVEAVHEDILTVVFCCIKMTHRKGLRECLKELLEVYLFDI